MISVLIEGTLQASPVMRTTAKDQPFATARVRSAGEDGETVWCSVIAFNATAVEALGSLSGGDTVAIAGTAALHHWTKGDGEHRVGLRITATRVMSAYDARQRRKAAERRASRAKAEATDGAGNSGWSDEA